MIGIVTVLYNCAPVLGEFFQTLNEQTYKDFILYVIDNKSSDNSLEEAERLSQIVDFKSVMLPQEENGGVARGNNIGIKAALEDKCDHVLLANNDIVLEPDSIEKLLEGMNRHGATMAVPKIYYWNTDKIIWMAGGKFKWLKARTKHRGERKRDNGQYDVDGNIEYAPTCFMLIQSDVFHRIGLMDERYFVYFDDTDFIWRAIKKGRERLYYIHESLIHHKVSFSTGGDESNFSIRYTNRNRVLFVLKHYGFFHKICVFLFLLFKFCLKDCRRLNREQAKLQWQSYLRGVKDFKSYDKDDKAVVVK